jgi:hypothetical protein
MNPMNLSKNLKLFFDLGTDAEDLPKTKNLHSELATVFLNRSSSPLNAFPARARSTRGAPN